MQTSFASTAPLSQAAAISSLALPSQALLRRYLEGRLEADTKPQPASGNPVLHNISRAAMWLYSQRRHVDSYPLLYNTLALAHPN